MGLKSILVYADDGAEQHLALAASLAKTHDATLTACHIVVPLEPAVYGASGMFGSVAEKHLQHMFKHAENWQRKVEKLAKENDISIHWRQLEGNLIDSLKRELLFYDLFISGPSVQAMSAPILGGALIASGCPALITPKHWQGGELGHNVLATWKHSAASKRALLGALPVLKNANKVEVVSVAKPNNGAEDAAEELDQLQQWLSTKGVASVTNVIPKIGETTASALKSYYQDSSADLLVMGCYGHRRLFEWVFGGVTQDLLVNPAMPLLITH